MASVSVDSAGRARSGELLLGCVAEHGTASHAYFGERGAAQGAEAAATSPTRSISCARCTAATRASSIMPRLARVEPAARAWLIAAAEAMAAERHYLDPALGRRRRDPLDTGRRLQRNRDPGAARRARHPGPVRPQGHRARRGARLRRRLGSDPRSCSTPPRRGSASSRRASTLGERAILKAVADEAGATAAGQRALLFGAEQLALQHRGLWDLLEARAVARREY